MAPHRRRPSRQVLATPTALLLAALAASTASAQSGAAGDADQFFVVRDVLPAGGVSASSAVSVESAFGHATAGPPAASASYRVQGGAIFTGPELTLTGPLVFGLEGGQGDRLGGEAEVVYGVNFAPGAGMTTVAIGGAGVAATVQSDLSLAVTSPAGVDAIGNPLGATDVTVTNQLGSSTAADGYVYTPALRNNAEARLGKVYRVHYLGEPGSFVVLMLGLSHPTISLPYSFWDGQFDLVTILFYWTPFLAAPDGSLTVEFTIPDHPDFLGFPFEFQAAALDSISPPGGSFTNNLLSIGQS